MPACYLDIGRGRGRAGARARARARAGTYMICLLHVLHANDVLDKRR